MAAHFNTLILLTVTLLAASSTAAQGGVGEWSTVIPLPLVAVSVANLPDGNLLLWASFTKDGFQSNAGTTSAIFNVATSTSGPAQVTNTIHNMFCPATALMFDGKLLVNGGTGSDRTSIYNPVSKAWTLGGNAVIPRGYSANTVLSNGNVFTIGGSWSGSTAAEKDGEVYSGGKWRLLPGIKGSVIETGDKAGRYRSDNHAWLVALNRNVVFHAGPSKSMNFFNTNGTGSSHAAGQRGSSADAMNGNAVYYAPGKLITMGGSTDYVNSVPTNRAFEVTIVPSPSSPTGYAASTREVGQMNFARTYHSSVVLPDGTVFVVGGMPFAEVFSDKNAILIPELYNPTTSTFRTLAQMSVQRTYHSVAILMKDGRVFVAGGGLCANMGCNVNHLDAQIYTPPYLLNPGNTPAVRPDILQAPKYIKIGTTFRVEANQTSQYVVVRMGAATHSVNNDQRRTPLTTLSTSGLTATVSMPRDTFSILPGLHFLFAINSAGVPSIARVVRIGP